MLNQCNSIRATVLLSCFVILCSPLLLFGLAHFSNGPNRNGPFPDFDWDDDAQDVRDQLTGENFAAQWRINLRRLLALVNVTAVPFALTSPLLGQTLKANSRAPGFARTNENEYSPLLWRSVHVAEKGKDVVFVCGLPCSKGLENNLVKWSFKLNESEEMWGNVPNDYPRFFTVKFKDCDGLSVLVIHHVGDTDGGAMFKCHYRKKNVQIRDDNKPNETIIESVVELVLLDEARSSGDVELGANATTGNDTSELFLPDSTAILNETDYNHKEENQTLLFADFQQPSADDIPKLLKLLNVTKSLTVGEFAPVETGNDDSAAPKQEATVTYNNASEIIASATKLGDNPKMVILRYSLSQRDRLLLQCANVSGDYHPDVHWYVANETGTILEDIYQSFAPEHNTTRQIVWVPFENDFPRTFLITLKNSGGNRMLVLLENKKSIMYKCSYRNQNGQNYEILVYLSLSSVTNENRTSHVQVDNSSRLSAVNETKIMSPVTSSRNGEQVLINMLNWFQNTLDFYVELLRVKAKQSKLERGNDISNSTSETPVEKQSSKLTKDVHTISHRQAALKRKISTS